MTSKKLLAVSVVLAMAFGAGCSSNKGTDTGSAAGAGGDGSSSTASGSYDPNAMGGSGSDAYAQAGRTVYFGYDQAALSSDAQSILDSNIAKLKNGSQQIRVEGHADERGTREYNLALGERRANVVLQYLVANGIAKGRIETISYGKERPVDPGHDEAAWAKNRRVELVY
ncbi:MAG TPA: peptidoglycan-associated lipoprotein Pal [Spongiibacteraceae bacterium]|nr:peptidoglycan-associated lipoprotein Pal [Spongiibacteraceae bacterium]